MLIVVVLSVAMGVVLGLLGGGGSILTLPILLYAAHVPPKQAIATSLVVVGTTSLVGALQHARLGHVRWRTGLLFGGAGMIGAYLGGRLADYIPANVLLMSFAAVMLVAGVTMLRPRKTASDEKTRPFRAGPVILEGLVVGAVTGLVGAGGGFLVVPALVVFGGMPMHAAIGTSLMIIALKSFAGAAGHLSHVAIDLELTAIVTAAAVIGGIGGTALSARVDPARLRQVFALLVLAMAAFMFVAPTSS